MPDLQIAGEDRHSPTPNDPSPHDHDYWNAFITEVPAGDFLGYSKRTMQELRQKGGGPRYVALSPRAIRYTRKWLREYAEARVRASTSDTGEQAA